MVTALIFIYISVTSVKKNSTALSGVPL